MKRHFVMSLAILIPSLSFGWGSTGHKTVAEIANRMISPQARQAVSLYLGSDSMATAAVWADEIRGNPKNWSHTFNYHFESVDDSETYLQSLKRQDLEADLEEVVGDGVVAAVIQSQRILKDRSSSKEEKTRALKFLIHFIGDIHQPLHSGRPGDQGGNQIERRWNGKKTNLHAIWDTHMMQDKYSKFARNEEQVSEIKYADFLMRKFQGQQIPVKADQIDYWIKETMTLRPLVYSYAHESEDAYTERFIDQSDKALYTAGVRLAAILTNLSRQLPESSMSLHFTNAIENIVGSLKQVISLNPRQNSNRTSLD